MAYALFHNKLWGVHLNDQNGLKYDQDKTFGSVDLAPGVQPGRTSWSATATAKNGEVVGLDVKAMRTQPAEKAFLHLKHSKEIFLDLVDLVHAIDRKTWQGLRGRAGLRRAGAVYREESDGQWMTRPGI